jgi:cysteine desulfuration protein SufE
MLLPYRLNTHLQHLQSTADLRQKYEYLLRLSQQLPGFPESKKQPENQIHGCTAQVYITVHLQKGRVWLNGDSDAAIVKGLIAFLVQGLSGTPIAEFCQMSPAFIQQTGLESSLIPSRAAGFYNIFSAMQQKAIQLATETDREDD